MYYYKEFKDEIIPEDEHPSRKFYYIANEFILIIKHWVFQHISEFSGEFKKSYLDKLQKSIENFAYDASLEGYDGISSYWEEFCFQLQYGDGDILEIILDGIEDHLYSSLNKSSIKDILILFTLTDEFVYNEYYCDYTSPHPDKSEMIESIVPKLMEELKNVGSTTYIPDFSSGEDWDE